MKSFKNFLTELTVTTGLMDFLPKLKLQGNDVFIDGDHVWVVELYDDQDPDLKGKTGVVEGFDDLDNGYFVRMDHNDEVERFESFQLEKVEDGYPMQR